MKIETHIPPNSTIHLPGDFVEGNVYKATDYTKPFNLYIGVGRDILVNLQTGTTISWNPDQYAMAQFLDVTHLWQLSPTPEAFDD